MNLTIETRNPIVRGTTENPFRSFWMGGFECTDKLNAFGNRVDFLKITGHLELLSQDYQMLNEFNLQTVREGIRWSQVEKTPYEYDWTTVVHMMKLAKIHGIQVVWDLCHFGFPDDLTPLHPKFAHRFAALARAFVQMYRSYEPDETLIITPINEVSFLSWLGGDVRGTSPYAISIGFEVKYALMRAYIEAVNAIREVDKRITILSTEPLVSMVPPLDATEAQIEAALESHESQYQAMDMLSGRICPELGGSPECIDILGFNYYYNNQWIHGTGQFLPWANDDLDPRWRPLRSLLTEAYYRYNCPIALTETSHCGEHRPNWISFVAEECAACIEDGIPLWGICLYPIIDRPDWDHLTPWHASGLWDAGLKADGPPDRILYKPYAEVLLQAQQRIITARNKKVLNLTEITSDEDLRMLGYAG